ncbi:NfeD family protein [Miniphocaeibacter halophilus]|uniref:Uncharacterized protein n=1 Tax=Miniphocaeibacter halophilus TaxID=2931922 RepID=A0AC61MQ51_9FIRM|nr:NfeD family protein [Miniphocaeibacter halophilus]QQK07637.1 hypothetical protein JFY71_10130 [Miniphocaeibacter halophilus]
MKKYFLIAIVLIFGFCCNTVSLASDYYKSDYAVTVEKNYEKNEINLNTTPKNVNQVKSFSIKNNNFFSNFIRNISNPFVSGILLIISIVAIIIEIFLPTYGIAGIISIISIVLFFAGNFLYGDTDIIDLILFIIGCILIAIEILVPGFGIPGIAGIILIVLGVILSMSNLYVGLLSISIASIIGFLVLITIIRKGYKSKLFNRIVLDKEIKSYSSKDNRHLLGKKGLTITPLRPSGTIEIDNKKIDALTEGEFIDKGEKVEVVNIEGFKIFVRRYYD